MSRPEVLFLAHRIPYPPNKGDKIRSHRIFEFLRQHFDVHLAAFVDDPADFGHQDYLKGRTASLALIPVDRRLRTLKSAGGFATGEPLSVAFYRSRVMRRAVDAMRARPLAGEIAFSSTMAQYLQGWKPGRPRVIDLCDADSVKWADYAARKSFPLSAIFRRESARLADVERQIIQKFDLSFAISPAEAAQFENHVHGAVDWFGNGVDTDYFDPHRSSPDTPASYDVVFTGAMDYWANVDAARWFVSDIWPIVRGRRPDAKFAIVGSNPHPCLKSLDGRDGVTLTGRVADIRPYLAGARVAIAPMRIARGVQNKVLEAMAAGRAVVSTSGGATGLEIEPERDFLLRDDPAGFAEAVVDLLGNDARASALGEQARRRMVAGYQWPAQLARFDSGLRRVGMLA